MISAGIATPAAGAIPIAAASTSGVITSVASVPARIAAAVALGTLSVRSALSAPPPVISPVPEPLPIEPLPIPPAIQTIEKPKPAIPAPTRPPIVRKAAPESRPLAQSRSAETSVTNQAAPQETPAPSPRTMAPPVSGEWQQSLQTWLARHKTYPYLARQRGIEGIVALRFTADRAGHVLAVELVQSAGSATLDDAAEAILRNATLPPFPSDMPQDKVTVTVQIRYTLAN